MLIDINIASGTVSVGDTVRKVQFPEVYKVIGTMSYDTETANGSIEYLEHDQVPEFTLSSVVSMSLSLWQAAAGNDFVDTWEKVKERRNLANAGGVFVRGHGYHTDLESLHKYAIMYSKIAVDSLADDFVFHPMWKTISGEFSPMTVSVLKSIINLGMRNVSINFANAERHKAIMKQSPTPATYDYSAGWTISYA